MKKDTKQRLFEVMSRLDKTFKPKLNENVESSYERVDLKGHGLDEYVMEHIAEIIFYNSDTYQIDNQRVGHDYQDFNIKLSDLKDHPDWSNYNLYLDDSDFTQVGTINVDRFVGKISDFFETGSDAYGEGESRGWFNAVKGLEELSLVDDKNRIIYNIPKGDYIFNSIDSEMERKSQDVFDDEWIKNQYDPY